MSSEFGRLFFLFGTVAVLSIVWNGYAHNSFTRVHAWSTVAIVVVYMVSFLAYRHMTAHIETHMVHEPLYMVLASIHGVISLAAILLACIVFSKAPAYFARGENYFRTHEIRSLLLVLLWPLALLSGLLI